MKRSENTLIEQGTFTPLVFTTTGGMADECLRCHSRLAELLSAKKQDIYATTISWVRAKVSVTEITRNRVRSVFIETSTLYGT